MSKPQLNRDRLKLLLEVHALVRKESPNLAFGLQLMVEEVFGRSNGWPDSAENRDDLIRDALQADCARTSIRQATLKLEAELKAWAGEGFRLYQNDVAPQVEPRELLLHHILLLNGGATIGARHLRNIWDFNRSGS